MRHITASIIVLGVVFLAGCSQPGKREAVYGNTSSYSIEMVQLHADQSFFLILDTLEQRGSYSEPSSTEIVLKPMAGETVHATITGDTLHLGDRILTLWKKGTSATSFLNEFVGFRNIIEWNRTEIQRDIVEISRAAKQFHSRSGSYKGFAIPDEFKARDYVAFSVEVTPTQILLKGTSTRVDGAVQVTISSDGGPTHWTYFSLFM